MEKRSIFPSFLLADYPKRYLEMFWERPHLWVEKAQPWSKLFIVIYALSFILPYVYC
jgi:hypothetical protein